MTRAVGLDIGTRTIKLVELAGSPKALKVQRLAIREVPTPPPPGSEGREVDPDELLAEAVRSLFEELKLPREDVCATFDAGSTIFREITVPFREEDQIRKVVKFEAENHLHSRSIEDVVVNWVKTGDTRDGSRLMIMASPKEELTRRLAILRRAGVDPASVDLDATATYAAAQAAGVFERTPNVILLEVGARSTNLMLVLEGRPRMMRSFLLGAESLAAGISRDLELPVEEARKRARASAGPRSDDLFVPAGALQPAAGEAEKSLAEIETDAVHDKRVEFVRKLHREAVRSLAAVPAEAPPDRILICGGGALLPGVVPALAERFELPVEPLDLGDRVSWRDLGADPEYAKAAAVPAVGAGLRMLGYNPLGIELLREEFQPTNLFDVVKVPLAWAVTLLFFVVLGLALIARYEAEAERKRFVNVLTQVRSIYRVPEKAYLQAVKAKTAQAADQEIDTWLRSGTPQDHTRIDAIRSLLLRRHRELEGTLGLAKDIPSVPSAVEVWFQVYKELQTVPREQLGLWFRVTKMEITARQAVVGFEVDDQATLDTIARIFEKSAYFKERARRANEVVTRGRVVKQGDKFVSDLTFQFKDEG